MIHAGIYYAPGSLKARLCVEGARELYEYCEQRGIRAVRCGKVIVATDESELPRLDELERRGARTACPAWPGSTPRSLQEIEPAARGLAALHSPATGVVDFAEITRALAREVEEMGGQVIHGVDVQALHEVGRRCPGGAQGGHAERDQRGCMRRGSRPTGWRWPPARRPTRGSSRSAAPTCASARSAPAWCAA